MNRAKISLLAAAVAAVTGCASKAPQQTVSDQFYGTQEPFAAEAIYFVMTDRFVDGDPQNNYPEQGGDHPTWELRLNGPDGKYANVGYMGGDLKGVLKNGEYIADMGFTAVWLTPVVDNPDQAFTGDEQITYGGKFKDGGKTGYHGYWATNFYRADEHLISEDLSFSDYTQAMKSNYGLKTVFDIVANHGSPSWTMPVDQPGYGELYDAEGNLVADHLNLPPEELDTTQPLQAFYHNFPDLVKLSNLNESNPAVQDYLINSYLHWIEQGADAFRIDTIRHVPHSFWRVMSDRIRAEHPGFYMFGESFQYDANFIAQHTLPKNGGISVLDFPMQKAMVSVFENPESDYAELEPVLFLTHGPYNNPYDLTTFYDNHDMARMNASDTGFIDAHNWLFTARGIPVVYQGSEIGFMRGTEEHQGNRNYLGQENIELAKQHPIRAALKQIAQVRKVTPALQRGLQLNLELSGNTASFYRIVQDGDAAQTALVLLNKGEEAESFSVSQYIQAGTWREQLSGEAQTLEPGQALNAVVTAHGVEVWVREGRVDDPLLADALRSQMAAQ
ncbi:cyclomaltodextrin glucanotransferase [Alteromonas aestuariivivens]|uniref:Cyclomaltodextrin glucanotransferase n=1 Tax=Alteromonas aestuariivivens TaxID=1938339 RepID=A0A3D8M830_9ALTE|nr:alpha-amylase family glycosyl hydrolase [Alteromonas aestuariivivens]RDV26045.1 cyclomaltodextrin glucanotransferase [Alteromonas aestuariivivens]